MNGLKRLATSGRCSVRGCHGPVPPNGTPPGGFTLVELLIVITIIGILAGLALAALSSTRQTARISKTKAVIAKLDLLVQQHYDSYRTRRVTVYEYITPPLPALPTWVRVNPSSLRNPVAAAHLRLHAIRDLMRMEMPERWLDIRNGPPAADLADPAIIRLYFASPPSPPTTRTFRIGRPSLSAGYRRKKNEAPAPPPGDSYDSAECLYLWVTRAIPGSREQFAENEIGDADLDTFPEFIDAWGNPIKFLRWAPAFLDSDVQQNVFWNPGLPNPDEDNRNIRVAASELDHDPFDARVVDLDPDPSDPNLPPRGGWRLVPLIYSAGPDGIYGISTGGTYSYDNKNPGAVGVGCEHFAPNPYYEYDTVTSAFMHSNIGGLLDLSAPGGGDNISVTGPKEVNGLEDYLDNIHNHRAEGN
jgi:prepilin-type N-terminal cleavage/methylation domain-containing protein